MVRRLALMAAAALGTAMALVAAPASAVVNGEPDTGDAFPYVGTLVIQVPAETAPAVEYHYWCSGTMVSPTVFLTAGHCFDQAFLASVFGEGSTVVGLSLAADVSGFMPDDPTQYTGTGMQITGYPGRHGQLDVGAYVLDGDGDGVYTGPLPTLPAAGELDTLALTGQQATIVGYGMTRDATGGRNGFTTFDDGVRSWAPQRITGVTPTLLHLLGAIAAGGSGPCAGDSGAPRLVDTGERPMLVAISNAAGPYCQTPEKALRLDSPEVLAFLDGLMAP